MQNVPRIPRLQLSIILLVAALITICANLGHARVIPTDVSNAAPRTQRDTTQRSVADQSEDGPACLTSSPKGVWGQYSAHDLPRGSCSGTDSCILWTRDSCPGTASPGPAIKWKCACASGTWRCDEQERSKTVCPNSVKSRRGCVESVARRQHAVLACIGGGHQCDRARQSSVGINILNCPAHSPRVRNND